MEKVEAPGRKTHVYRVRNKKSTCMLGSIKWYSPWRRYCFFTIPGEAVEIFSSGCLSDIQSFIDQLMEARKK